MDLTVLFFVCLLVPINTPCMPAESIAIVDLEACLKLAPTAALDSEILAKDIGEAEKEAKRMASRHEGLEALSKQKNATELDQLKAKISKLEFDAFRKREQARLREAEQEMFRKWHRQVNAAVKLVAEREEIAVVLYVGTNANKVEVPPYSLQQMLEQTHAGFLSDQTRPDITGWVLQEMTTPAFLTAIETEASKSGH